MATKYSPRIVTNGLVLCLDAGNSRSYPGTGTTWYDLSGFRHIGANLVHAPVFVDRVPPHPSSAGGLERYFTFDGANDYVNLGTQAQAAGAYLFEDSGVANTTGPPPFTMEFFVRRSSSASGTDCLLRVDDWSRTNLQMSDSLISHAIGYGGTQDTVNHSITITDGIWYYIAFTWIKLTTQQIYVNGVLGSQGTPSQSSFAGTTGDGGGANLFRGHTNPYQNFFNGDLAVYRLYNRVLTATEITQNYTALKGRFGL